MNIDALKIFDRDFLTAHFAPALFLLLSGWALLEIGGASPAWLKIKATEPLQNTLVVAAITWVLAMLFHALNREIYRSAEGYWPWNSQTNLSGSERRRFNALRARIQLLEKAEDASAEGLPAKYDIGLNNLLRQIVAEFPSREDLVLPTRFGNAVRAYEDYPRVMYGFESIQGWSRLEVMMSKEFRELLGGNRALTTMWLNLSLVFSLLAIEAVCVAIWSKPLVFCFAPIFAAAVYLVYRRAVSAALREGEVVKAAFDVYLPDLAKKLGVELSNDPKINRKFWQAFSQGMVYREREALADIHGLGLTRRTAQTPTGAKTDA